MRTYYRGPDAVVTSIEFASRTTSESYAIRDLRNVCIHHLTTGAVLWRLRPQTFLLRATYRGIDVTLYESTDKRVFHQVARALRRALEDARPPATWGDRSAA